MCTRQACVPCLALLQGGPIAAAKVIHPAALQAAQDAGVADEDLQQWRSCWQPYRNAGAGIIQPVEALAVRQADEQLPWFNRLQVVINGVVYHGLPEQVR